MTFSHSPPKIIPTWILISTLLVLWDCGYIFLRPRSMPGGDLHKFWKHYGLYGTVDHVYGFPAFESNDGFPGAQSFMNLIESALNFTYLALWARGNSTAVLVGLVSATMTLSKTILYLCVEYFSGWRHIGHNDFATLVLLYITPNGFWVLLPSYCIWWFAGEIHDRLKGKEAGAKSLRATANAKKSL
ncbi:uncharacterized protein LAJ45_02880 [Morchella importuna]|uniref:EXPERA domain-containing protein n=1 Tax=Morchella conica CCBAS932 TaxID=1392247 RepID=A0A3N4L493_9PEZI|nr:uncharacterized protein LAJ45_02880 [Morchella importuna]KAH8153293.1 hypothetical protein LAJ45_02880 [Morchella importuna]RPB15451.1 hypothetical protein P167DRAFT_518643 [Morchella conica CCBAS932]